MENAGRAAAQVLERLFPRGPVVALVGSGNNGGDALVLLRTLASWGRPVRAVLAADRLPAAPVLHGWDVPGIADPEPGGEDGWRAALAGAAVVVDGVLGTGIKGPPRARQARAVRAVNGAARRVLALDVPSGVDADTGATPGDAVKADVTVCFGWPKLGALLPPGRELAGRVVAVEIGFPPAPEDTFGCAVITPGWATATRPRRRPETHKNEVGSLLLVAGRTGMAGAAVMAARAALRCGVGLVRVLSAAENRGVLQAAVPEAIFVPPGDGAVAAAAGASRAVAAGPGLGTDEGAAELLRAALEATTGLPSVLDADALNLAAGGLVPSLAEVARGRPLLVTPHPGEMRRISGVSPGRTREARVEVARAFATETDCALLLKGLPSVVAAPGGRVWVDALGSSDLATGGMGDVLTGACGAFLAQGAPPAEAGALALHHTGRAATLARRGAGLLPGDVVRWLPEALREEGPGDTELGMPFVLFDRDAPR